MLGWHRRGRELLDMFRWSTKLFVVASVESAQSVASDNLTPTSAENREAFIRAAVYAQRDFLQPRAKVTKGGVRT